MISAAVICQNEENKISKCLGSLNWADEIIVVDGGSTDSTAEIAHSFTDKIYTKKWQGYKTQREFAISKTSNEWVFILDADEICTDELRDEIINTLSSNPQADAYKIPRKSFFLNKWIKYSGWYPDLKLRLFRKGLVSVTNRLVHEGYTTEGITGYLKGNIEHYTVSSVSEYMNKVNKYSTLAATEKSEKRIVGFRDLFFRPISSFLRIYIFKQGFRDGIFGLMVAYFDVITNILTYMKIHELQNHKEVK